MIELYCIGNTGFIAKLYHHIHIYILLYNILIHFALLLFDQLIMEKYSYFYIQFKTTTNGLHKTFICFLDYM